LNGFIINIECRTAAVLTTNIIIISTAVDHVRCLARLWAGEANLLQECLSLTDIIAVNCMNQNNLNFSTRKEFK